jgi:putative membrane protein
VGAISAIYEVLEWLLAIIAAPEVADRHNGQQGDAWDAQKDMALAIVGSLLVLPCLMMRGPQTPPTPMTAP